MSHTLPTVQLAYEERGQGLPVVLLHGYPLDHTLWRAQIAALGDAYRVIAPDLRGHGASPAPAGDYSMDSLAADVAALLDRLGVERAVWVGHSMGGYVALAALRTLPQRVAGLALCASHPFADPPEKAASRRASAEQARREGTAPVVSGMLPLLFRPGTNLETVPAHLIRSMMLRTPPQGVAGVLDGMAARPDAVDMLRPPAPPKAILAGREDQIVRLADLQALVAELPHVALHVMDGAGHLPMIEQPEATTAALRAFLAAL
ncbi:MAG: alpha/beta fold hydrolase [Anaerolineae bacterium]|nr:alpha/beta fold hydrolase [Anaerolineae bacterium]